MKWSNNWRTSKFVGFIPAPDREKEVPVLTGTISICGREGRKTKISTSCLWPTSLSRFFNVLHGPFSQYSLHLFQVIRLPFCSIQRSKLTVPLVIRVISTIFTSFSIVPENSIVKYLTECSNDYDSFEQTITASCWSCTKIPDLNLFIHGFT